MDAHVSGGGHCPEIMSLLSLVCFYCLLCCGILENRHVVLNMHALFNSQATPIQDRLDYSG